MALPAIAGGSVVAGEFVLALGGIGGTGQRGSHRLVLVQVQEWTLSAGKAFLLYGTSNVVSGAIVRAGANYLAPELVDPVSSGTVAMDFVTGGAIGSAFKGMAN